MVMHLKRTDYFMNMNAVLYSAICITSYYSYDPEYPSLPAPPPRVMGGQKEVLTELRGLK